MAIRNSTKPTSTEPASTKPATKKPAARKPTSRIVRQWAAQWLQQRCPHADSLDEIANAYLRWLGPESRPPPGDATASLAWEYLEKYHATGHASFYAWEYLLEAAQPRQRVTAGVYFTPAVISQWLVSAAIGPLSKTKGTTVTVIDPACGTGAMMVEAIDRLAQESSPDLCWQVWGVEKSKSTATVAEGLLKTIGPSASMPRAKIVEADALSFASLESFGHEAGAPLLILGNPPYSTGKRSATEQPSSEKVWIDGLLADYRTGLGERKSALADDYIRFLRWSQHQMERAGRGVLAMITSRTFLEGITHRRMRESLRQTFDELYVVDLGGDMSRNRDQHTAIDENVFPIRSGVVLLIFTRGLSTAKRRNGEPGTVFYFRRTGTREQKLEMLATTPFEAIPWSTSQAADGEPWGSSSTVAHHDIHADYDAWPSLAEAFHLRISGIQSKNDSLWTADTRPALLEQVRDQAGFEPDPAFIREYGAAPFVKRFIYYDPRRIGRPRFAGMRHMLRDNVGLVFTRQSTNGGPYDQVMATRDLIVDRFFYSRRGTPYVAPLVLYEANRQQSNLRREFMRCFVGPEEMLTTDDTLVTHETVFRALLSLLSSRVYRTRFADRLRVDFPRVPPSVGLATIERLAQSGRELVDLHCDPLAPSAGDKTTFSAEEIQHAENWTLGGYRILKRWGRDRAATPVADNKQWRPILQRWCAIEQALDRIDQVVEELLDR